MRIAVVTPCYRTPADWLEHCLQSVRQQTVPCTHFLVNDGDPDLRLPASSDAVRVASVPGPHRDAGNAARAVGSICAVCQGFDAIAYLDADNWYQPQHLESLLQLQQHSGAAVCTSARDLYHLNGTLLGRCPEVDGRRFVDTNCLLLRRAAFCLLSVWYQAPPTHKYMADRLLWQEVRKRGLPHAHSGQATVAYRTSYAVHYQHFGLQPPLQARTLRWHPLQQRWVLQHEGQAPPEGG